MLLVNDHFLSTTNRVYSDDYALRRSVTVSGVVVSLRCFKSLLSSIERGHPTRIFKENTLNVVSFVPRSICGLLKAYLCKLL